LAIGDDGGVKSVRNAVVALVALSACASSVDAVPATVAGVGEIPGVIGTVAVPVEATASTTSLPAGPVPVRPADLGEPTVAEVAAGNRVMLIGDSITAATAPRFGGSMCDKLTDVGWYVEINAEPGRFVSFADVVLDRRHDPGGDTAWDAAVIFLGSNLARFTSRYVDALDRLAPRPVVVLTVTEIAANRSDLNEVIRAEVAARDNVQLIDWAVITAAEPGLLARDGLHLSSAGGNRLVTEVALALGPAMVQVVDAECAQTLFTDDVVGSGSDDDL
jgi:hypothetical protein